MRINICLISDENFIQHLAVTIASILFNAANEDDFYFYLLLSENISQTNKEKILNLKKIKDCNIIFINIDVSVFKHYETNKRAANYKFLLADILKDIDKVLYLDCDLIVNTTLNKLYSENIDNYYIAAVEDYGYYYLNLHLNYYVSDFYINSGVMLINLKLWRQENLKDKFIQLKQQNVQKFIFIDQDVINLCCKNKIKDLPVEWNFQTDFFDSKRKFTYHPLNKKIKSIKNKNIIHFSTINKPWKAYSPKLNYYYKYLKMTDFKMNITSKLLINIIYSFLKYQTKSIIYFIVFLFSPIISIYKRNCILKLKIFGKLEFNLFKIKNKYLKH